MIRYVLPAAFSLCLLLMLISPSAAQDICVRCTGPEQTYRCQVDGAGVPSDGRALSFFCAAKIAEENTHASCAVVRRPKECVGPLRTYAYDPEAVPQFGAPLPDGTESEAAQAGPEKKREGPPDTLVDLTKETAKETGKVISKAGEKIGGAAKTAAKATEKTTRKIGEKVRDVVTDAGKAVDQAARKTLKCIGSALQNCFN